MSKSVNRVILVGNVGADPEVRRTPTGKTVANLSLATNRRFRVNGEIKERTDWHRLTFWDGAAETVDQYVRCGNRLYVEGRLQYGSYDRDGQAVATTDIVVQEFVFLDRRDDGGRVEDLAVDADTEEAAAV